MKNKQEIKEIKDAIKLAKNEIEEWTEFIKLAKERLQKLIK